MSARPHFHTSEHRNRWREHRDGHRYGTGDPHSGEEVEGSWVPPHYHDPEIGNFSIQLVGDEHRTAHEGRIGVTPPGQPVHDENAVYGTWEQPNQRWYCDRFTNNFGICTIVDAPNAREAKKLAGDKYYGIPGRVRLATTEDEAWYDGMTSPPKVPAPRDFRFGVELTVAAPTKELAKKKLEAALQEFHPLWTTSAREVGCP